MLFRKLKRIRLGQAGGERVPGDDEPQATPSPASLPAVPVHRVCRLVGQQIDGQHPVGGVHEPELLQPVTLIESAFLHLVMAGRGGREDLHHPSQGTATPRPRLAGYPLDILLYILAQMPGRSMGRL